MTDETLFAGLAVHHHQAVLVTLVPVPFHGRPSDPFAVRRISRIGVVAFVILGDIDLFPFTGRHELIHVQQVDIAVGGNGILESGLLAAGIRQLLIVRMPSQLLDAAERSHRALERRAFQDVTSLVHTRRFDPFTFTEISHFQFMNERLWNGIYPFVPMLV